MKERTLAPMTARIQTLRAVRTLLNDKGHALAASARSVEQTRLIDIIHADAEMRTVVMHASRDVPVKKSILKAGLVKLQTLGKKAGGQAATLSHAVFANLKKKARAKPAAKKPTTAKKATSAKKPAAPKKVKASRQRERAAVIKAILEAAAALEAGE